MFFYLFHFMLLYEKEVISMQKLTFEQAWDKTISLKDREKIHEVFLATNQKKNETIKFIPLWQAKNHKGELLVTVLIHNFSEQSLAFHNNKLHYLTSNNEIIAEHTFSHASLMLEPETSMPWTFIFPTIIKQPSAAEIGKLVIAD